MSSGIWVAKTGMEAQQKALSIISNNLANVNTVGYKRSRPVFESLLYQTITMPGSDTSTSTSHPSGLMLGTGVTTAATQKNFSQGSVIDTGNQFDITIRGRGFMQVLLPNGNIAYSRDGQLQVNENGELVNSHGYKIQPSITIPQGTKNFSVGADGVISVTTQDSSGETQLGTLELVDFINPAGLEPIGDNLYLQTSASGTPTTGNPGSDGLGSLTQGSLEGSNVNVVTELVNMIETQRAYEMNSKAIATADKMEEFADQVL